MRIELLEEFVVFSRHLNFSRAARELSMSQSALSTHVAALEREVGASLVIHGAKPLLTDAGKQFLEDIQNVIASYHRAVLGCRSVARTSPALRIKTTGTIPLLDLLIGELGPIPFELIEIPADAYEPFEELRRDVVDVMTCYEFGFSEAWRARAEEMGIASTRVGTEKSRIVVSKSNPLASHAELSASDLVRARVLVPSSKWYSFMVDQVSHLLDGVVGLEFATHPVSSPIGLRYLQLADSIVVCGTNYEELLNRDDVAVFDRVDGRELTVGLCVAYQADNPSANLAAALAAWQNKDW